MRCSPPLSPPVLISRKAPTSPAPSSKSANASPTSKSATASSRASAFLSQTPAADGASSVGASFDFGEDRYAAYQSHVAVRLSYIVAVLPDDMTFEAAVVLPLSLGVAAHGLFAHDSLSLEMPVMRAPARKEVVLIAGAASAVGATAIQLATLSGYSVVTTASPGNFDLAKKLGAAAVIDYRSESAVDDLVAAVKTQGCVCSLLIFRSNTACSELKGVFSTAKSAMLDPNLPDPFAQLLSVLDKLGRPTIPFAAANFPPSDYPYSVKFVTGTSPFRREQVGPFPQADPYIGEALFGVGGFVEEALRDGRIVPAPRAHLAGEGLEGIQAALDLYRSNVLSAAKAVIRVA